MRMRLSALRPFIFSERFSYSGVAWQGSGANKTRRENEVARAVIASETKQFIAAPLPGWLRCSAPRNDKFIIMLDTGAHGASIVIDCTVNDGDDAGLLRPRNTPKSSPNRGQPEPPCQPKPEQITNFRRPISKCD
jgi:hypothetical protein